MEFRIPESLKIEHEELHAELARAVSAGGRIGAAAKAVADVLHPHFVAEEELVLPPLGLMPSLAGGEISPKMRDVLAMTDTVKSNFRRMIEEHEAIAEELKNLIQEAMKAGKMEYAHLAKKIRLHAQLEEEVFYPAVILIGEHLKLKLGK